ncbi:hypothetical protein D3C73_1580090 [compost metagenome]
MGNKAVALSTTAPIPGIQIDAYYMNQGRPLYQRQAAFLISPGRALIFSTTAQADFSPQQNEDWANLLASFTPRNPVVTSAEPGEQE